jgi:hypothetical protein
MNREHRISVAVSNICSEVWEFFTYIFKFDLKITKRKKNSISDVCHTWLWSHENDLYFFSNMTFILLFVCLAVISTPTELLFLKYYDLRSGLTHPLSSNLPFYLLLTLMKDTFQLPDHTLYLIISSFNQHIQYSWPSFHSSLETVWIRLILQSISICQLISVHPFTWWASILLYLAKTHHFLSVWRNYEILLSLHLR